MLGVTFMLGGGGSNPAGGSSAAPEPLPVRALVFSVDPAVAQVMFASVGDGGNVGGVHARVQEADVAGTFGVYRIHVSGPGVPLGAALAGLEHVTVNGSRGYYGCLGASHSSTDVGTCNGGTLVWHYTSNAWAMIVSEGRAATKPSLLRLADALDFSDSTPLRSPVTVHTSLGNAQLAAVDAAYRGQDGDAPATLNSGPSWSFQAHYQLGGGDEKLSISAGPGDVPFAKKSAERVSVNGHPGYWFGHTQHEGDPSNHQLLVDTGHVNVTITAPATWSLSRARELAAGITIVAHPDMPRSWPTVDTALP